MAEPLTPEEIAALRERVANGREYDRSPGHVHQLFTDRARLLATLDAAPATGLREAAQNVMTTFRLYPAQMAARHVDALQRLEDALAAAPLPSHPDQVAKWDARARADAAVEDDIDMPDGYDPEGFNEPETPHA